MDEKIPTIHHENGDKSSADEESRGYPDQADDNYRGLDFKTVAVYLSVNLICMSQILNLVGAGAFARDISDVIGGSNNSVWLASALAILTCVLSPPVSQAADYWGRKWFVVVLTLFGGIGCFIVSRATSMGMAIAGEVVAGLAFGSQPLLYAVASEILPRRYRPIAQAGINISISIGAFFALLVGSAFVENFNEGFRIYWYLTAAIQVVAAAICAFLYNPLPRPGSILTVQQRLHQLDWLGYALLASGIVLFSMALSWSENPYSWTDAHVLGTFLLGAILLLMLAFYQVRFKSDGIFHHDLFRKDRNFALALICVFVEGMINSFNGFYAFETSVLHESDPIMIGVRVSITFFTAIFACVGIAMYSAKSKKLRIPTVVAYLSFCIFFILMANANLSSGTALWAYPIFFGFGLGVCLTCIVTAAQLSAPPSLIAISSGLMIGTRSLGGSDGLAIYNAIFNARLSASLPLQISSAVLPLGFDATQLPSLIQALANND